MLLAPGPAGSRSLSCSLLAGVAALALTTPPPLPLPCLRPRCQVVHLGGSSNQLAISVGTAVLVATLTELKPPTLANLLGALALDRVALCGRRSGGGGGSDLLAKPASTAAGALLGSTAVVNPAALAAARVLHADEVAALSAPFGGAARPMQLRLELEEPEEPGQWLVPAREVHWGPTDAAAVEQLAQTERRVWQEVAQPAAAALASDAALQAALAPLLRLRRSSGLALSPRLVPRLLMIAAGKAPPARLCWLPSARRCCWLLASFIAAVFLLLPAAKRAVRVWHCITGMLHRACVAPPYTRAAWSAACAWGADDFSQSK